MRQYPDDAVPGLDSSLHRSLRLLSPTAYILKRRAGGGARVSGGARILPGAGIPGGAKAFDALGSPLLRASLLSVSAVLPYLIESSRTGSFHRTYFLELVAAILVAVFWYALLPRGIMPDLLFLAVMAAVYLSQAFRSDLRILGAARRTRHPGTADVDPPGIDGGPFAAPAGGRAFGFVPSPKIGASACSIICISCRWAAALGYWERVARFHVPHDSSGGSFAAAAARNVCRHLVGGGAGRRVLLSSLSTASAGAACCAAKPSDSWPLPCCLVWRIFRFGDFRIGEWPLSGACWAYSAGWRLSKRVA